MTAAAAAAGDKPEVKETWDCSSVKVKPANSADGNKITQSTNEQFLSSEDWKYTGSKADFNWTNAVKGKKAELDKVKDANDAVVDSVADSSKNNFQISGGKSHTNCKIERVSSKKNKITCARPAKADDATKWMDSGITYHWFRNFSTLDEPGYDLQLTKDHGDKGIPALAFVWVWFDEAKSTSTPSDEVLNSSSEYKCTAITAAAYKKLITDPDEAEKKAAEEAAAKKKAEEDALKNKDKDGATQTTAFATALLAAVYALVF